VARSRLPSARRPWQPSPRVSAPLLAHQLVVADGATPTRWMIVLHGIFGMGTNFRTLARALATERPGWGFVLVDLRGHGASQGFPPPHDLAAVAGDLAALADHLGLRLSGIAGHSFGGKAALAYVAAHPGALDVALVLDSSPGMRRDVETRESATRVLGLLESLPSTFPTREAFVERLLAEGYARGIVDWLTMNVRRQGDAYALRLDLRAIRELLDSYFSLDLWPIVDDPESVGALHVILGGRSEVFDGEAKNRLALAETRNPRLVVRVLPSAGHWLHVDDPAGVLDSFRRALDAADTRATSRTV
jgi:esterase